MNYKGEDLDLRTPQGWSASRDGGPFAGEVPGAGLWNRSTIYNGGRADPLWVDEIALACLNHAYDLAVAHRSADVQIEHLLNAMTLNPTASRILDDHGVAVSALRHESAGIVATVIPAGLNGKNIPNTSNSVEEILRHAADRAYPDRNPISIDTILEVMTEMKQDLTGLDLLRRHAASHTSSRYTITEDNTVATVPTANHVTDTVQNSRLDALEQLVRSLSQDLTTERQAYANLVGDIQRNSSTSELRRHTISTRSSDDDDEAIRLVAERLEAIETGIEDRFSGLARGWVEIGDRLRDLERSVEQRPEFAGAFPDTDVFDSKLAALEQTFTLILDRLTGLERRLETGVASATGDLGPVTDMLAGLESRTSESVSGTRAVFERISALEKKLDTLAIGAGADTSGLEQRLDAVASRFGEQVAPLRQSIADFEQRAARLNPGSEESLEEVHEALLKLNGNQQTLSSSVDQWRLDQTGDLSLISNRMQSVEGETHSLKSLVETMASNIGVVYAILARREENKSKFKNWLFGTDDWYSASWDTERWRQQVIAAGGFVPMPRRRAKQAAANA